MNVLTADVAIIDPVEQRLLERANDVRKIFFRNLLVDAHIGVHAQEQGRTQPLRINIVLYMRADTAPKSDSFAEVFDYDQIRTGILGLAHARHINLQETLVEEISDYALAFEHVLAIRVSTEKIDIYDDCEGVGYELTRIRPD
jgi:dihydroneopterin aldolase